MASVPLGIFRCRIMNVRDVHDVSTADSLLCLLLDLVGDAMQHTTTAATCFAWSLVSQSFWALNMIFHLQNFMSFQVGLLVSTNL